MFPKKSMRKKIQASARAKRVVPIVLFINLATFFSFIVHLCLRGTSPFPAGGRLVGDHYLVSNHNIEYEFTHTQYWLSYIHGWAMVGTMFLYFAVVLFFLAKGELKTIYEDKK